MERDRRRFAGFACHQVMVFYSCALRANSRRLFERPDVGAHRCCSDPDVSSHVCQVLAFIRHPRLSVDLPSGNAPRAVAVRAYRGDVHTARRTYVVRREM